MLFPRLISIVQDESSKKRLVKALQTNGDAEARSSAN